MKITKKDLNKYLTPHFIKLYEKSFNDFHEVNIVHPKKLLSPKRFDIVIKYIYAWHKKNNVALEYATQTYNNHIGTWNSFQEGDGSKNCFDDYLRDFNALIDSKFDPNISLIPVSKEGVIIDGSHRTTACLINQVNPSVIHIDIPSPNYDYKYFRKLGTDEKVMNEAALKYAELDESLYLLFLFPIARDKDSEVEEIIQSIGEIAYSKELKLNENGMHNLVIQSYRDEKWIGSQQDNYSGAKKNANQKYKANELLQTYLIKVNSYEDTLNIKEQIRALFKYGNNSVHITDTHEETLRLAQQIYNKNSIEYLNDSKNYKNLILNQNAYIPDEILYVNGMKYTNEEKYRTSFLEKIDSPEKLNLLIIKDEILDEELRNFIKQNIDYQYSIQLSYKIIQHLKILLKDYSMDTLLKNKLSKDFTITLMTDDILLIFLSKVKLLEYKYKYDYVYFKDKEKISYVLSHILNKNTFHMLEHGKPYKYKNFLKNLDLFKKNIQHSNLNLNDFILVSSSVLGLYGLREPNDLDFLCIHKNFNSIISTNIESHHHVEEFYFRIATELINDQRNYIFFSGLKFLTLEGMILSNNNRIQNTKKTDIKLANLILHNSSNLILKLNYLRFIGLYQRTRRNICLYLKKNIPQVTNKKFLNILFCKEPSNKKILSSDQQTKLIKNLITQLKNETFESFSIYGISHLTYEFLGYFYLERINKKINFFIDSNTNTRKSFYNYQLLNPTAALNNGETNFVVIGYNNIQIMRNNLLIKSKNKKIKIIVPKI